jgi:hypothetical protein
MDYWVYEHWSAEKKARIHKGPCRYCKHGQGTDKRKPRGDANGRWHGAHVTVADADRAAQQTGRPVTRCKHCRP